MTRRIEATNSTTTYGWVERAFHWSIAILILTAVVLGLVASEAGYDTGEALARKAWLFSFHKTTGVAIFFLALARIGWALSQPRPKPLHEGWEAMLAALVHWVLYGSLVIVPLLGWSEHSATTGFAPILWPFGQSLPFVPKDPALAEVLATLHVTFVWVLVGAVGLHVAGAMKHAVLDRDATLARMWRGAEPSAVRGGARPIVPLALACGVWAVTLAVGLATVPDAGRAAPEVAAAATAPEASTAPAATDTYAGANATVWTVEQGTLSITVTQMGSGVTGSFADWDAEIDFDPVARADGTYGSVRVRVATGSLTLGSVSAQATAPDFLSSEAFPDAVFDAAIAEGTGDGYVARGTLSLRGVEIPLDLPFVLDIEDGVAAMTGRTELDRRDFAMGESYPDESSVGFGVVLDVELTARRGE